RQVEAFEAQCEQAAPLLDAAAGPAASDLEARRRRAQVKEGETHPTHRHLPLHEKAFELLQQLPAGFEQDPAVVDFAGELAFAGESLGPAMARARIRQAPECPVEIEERPGAEALQETLPRQAQAI